MNASNFPSASKRAVGRLILVAEDNRSDQFLLELAIQKAGLDVQVEFVSDGWDVVNFLQQPPGGRVPALLLLDLKMPGLSGFEVLEWLRQWPELRPPHVVVLSSSLQAMDIGRASQLAVDHYLVKPSDLTELVAAVKRLEPYWAEFVHLYVPAADTGLPMTLVTAA